MLSGAFEALEAEADIFCEHHGLSKKFGFLPKDPPCHLPFDLRNPERRRYFMELDRAAYNLPGLIAQKQVAETIASLPTPDWSARDLQRPYQYRLMFLCAMLMHAHAQEVIGYQTVDEVMAYNQEHRVPAQLARPLYELWRITGMRPTMSYTLYSQWNYRQVDPAKPVALDNLDLLHSFTGTTDEKWFVWTHQVVDYIFARAIPYLIQAYLLGLTDPRGFTPRMMSENLEAAAKHMSEMVSTLERMRERCDPGTYFREVRKFYTIPKNLIFEGVPELEGKRLNFLGETGGEDPFMQFAMSVLGLDFDGIEFYGINYFREVRQHMPKTVRDLVETVQANSRVREYVLERLRAGDRILARRYNAALQCLIDWRAEHYTLAKEYVGQEGEIHGTVKAPFRLLKDIYERTLSYRIDEVE